MRATIPQPPRPEAEPKPPSEPPPIPDPLPDPPPTNPIPIPRVPWKRTRPLPVSERPRASYLCG
jgi:protein TonB